MNNEKNEKSCWNCKYQDLNNDSFLGRCNWFLVHKKGPAKEIPDKIVDIGCKYYENK